MAWRITRKSCFSVDSRERCSPAVTVGPTMLASNATSSSTSSSSISVKPVRSPFRVGAAIDGDPFAGGVNVVHIDAVPGIRIGLVLVPPHRPLLVGIPGRVGERIARNAPQILPDAALGVAGPPPLHQHRQ